MGKEYYNSRPVLFLKTDSRTSVRDQLNIEPTTYGLRILKFMLTTTWSLYEDGDKIRVEVDGRSIFSGEIDNDWDCYTLDVWASESYAVELTALNGAGTRGTTVATETQTFPLCFIE